MNQPELKESCRDFSEGQYLPLYELGVLKEKEAIRFEDHLLVCSFCRRELVSLQSTMDKWSTQREAIRELFQQEGITYTSLLKAWKDQVAGAAREKKGWFDIARDRIAALLQTLTQPRELIPALGVTVFIVLSLMLLPLPEPTNPYLPWLSFDKVPYTRSVWRADLNAEAQRFFEAGVLLYQQNDYTGALGYFKKATEQAPEESLYRFYLGLNYYLQRQPQLAIQALSQAESLAEPAQRNQALWYLAQAYLLEGDVEPARAILTALANQELEYAVEAEQLLRQLKQVARHRP